MSSHPGHGSGNYYDQHYPPPLPPPPNGLKLRAHKRPIGRSDLTRELEHTLERNIDEKRCVLGAAYAREGRLHDIWIGEDGVVSARAVGSRHYEVALRFKVFSPKLRKKLVQGILAEPEILSVLSNGMVPLEALEELIASISPEAEELVPLSVRGTCSCPYGAGCKHQAALGYLLVEALDTDQSLLLALRGISRDELAAEIGRPTLRPEPQTVSLSEFWAPAQMPSKIITPRPEVQELLARLKDIPEGISQDEAYAVQEMLKVVLTATDTFA